MAGPESVGSQGQEEEAVSSMALGVIRSQGITDPAQQREHVQEELDFCSTARSRYADQPDTMARVAAIEGQLWTALDTLDAGGVLTFPVPEQQA